MSLHALANHLQQAGRGDDKVLIHMTPKEVKGLQSLAMAHGGSLTINPKTGLPEAGFLSRLLPTLIGAGLTIASGGALSPLMAAGITGAGYGIAKGSLKEGLMAGLGAYGGAGLASGLGLAGAESIGSGLGEFGANAGTGTGADYGAWMGTKGGELAGQQAVAGMPTSVGMGTTDIATNLANSTGGINAAPIANLSQTNMDVANAIQKLNPQPITAPPMQLQDAGGVFNKGLVNQPINGDSSLVLPKEPLNVGEFAKPTFKPYAGSSHPYDYTSDLARKANDPLMEAVSRPGSNTYSTRPSWLDAKPTPPPSAMDKIGAGFREATGSFEGLKNVWDKTPTGTGYGLAATAMGLMQDSQNKGTGAPAPSDSYLRPYDYSVEQDPNAYAPNASTAERRYFTDPRFIARPIEKIAKEGGLMSINNYAVGGPVEEMSAQNAISGNTMYPQSQLQTPMYSNPSMSRPLPTNVIQSGGDAPTQPYSGEILMASGGLSKGSKSAESTSEKKYSYDPESMKFTEMTTTPAVQGGNRVNMPIAGLGYTGIGGGGFNPMLANLAKQQTAPQPTVARETSGGIAKPFTPEGQAMGMQYISMVPNTQVQPLRTPEQQLGLENFYANMNQRLAEQGGYAGYAAGGGISTLGGYSDGGRLLKGPGDGVSDSIPASIGDRQPARLADGEFVVPARIVSEIGNGSTEAGARKLYAMMERVQNARRRTTGKNQVAKNTKAERLLPA